MKAKLIKTDKDNYTLFDEKGIPIGNTPNVISNNTFSKLSKQNCDEIFGVIDVEKLAGEITKEYATLTPKAFKRGVVLGFNKAMELNKDKVFTLEDMRNAIEMAQRGSMQEQHNGYGRPTELRFVLDNLSTDEIIQSLQQPTEIEVEIEMEYVGKCNGNNNNGCFQDSSGHNCRCFNKQPKLDSQGNLILKKI